MQKQNSNNLNNFNMKIIKFRVFDKNLKAIKQWEDIKHLPLEDLIKEPYTLMQFTGAIDKQGNEIYEGDIVKLSCGYNSRYRSISFNNYGSYYQIGELGISFGKMKKDGYVDCEVIGNIFENDNFLVLNSKIN